MDGAFGSRGLRGLFALGTNDVWSPSRLQTLQTENHLITAAARHRSLSISCETKVGSETSAVQRLKLSSCSADQNLVYA